MHVAGTGSVEREVRILDDPPALHAGIGEPVSAEVFALDKLEISAAEGAIREGPQHVAVIEHIRKILTPGQNPPTNSAGAETAEPLVLRRPAHGTGDPEHLGGVFRVLHQRPDGVHGGTRLIPLAVLDLRRGVPGGHA